MSWPSRSPRAADRGTSPRRRRHAGHRRRRRGVPAQENGAEIVTRDKDAAFASGESAEAKRRAARAQLARNALCLDVAMHVRASRGAMTRWLGNSHGVVAELAEGHSGWA